MEYIKPRFYSYAYIVALSIIAILTIFSHLLVSYTLNANDGYAKLINVSGRQRMYSQRIASLSAQYLSGDIEAHKALVKTITNFQNAHKELISSNTVSQDGNSNARKLYYFYFSGPNSINNLLNKFTMYAWIVANSKIESPEAKQALNHIYILSRDQLLNELDQVVHTYQLESERRLAILDAIQWVVLGIVLLTLFLEAIFLFRPMLMKLIRFTEQLFKLATNDGLTKVSNRHHFLDECRKSLRQQKEVNANGCNVVFMLDADNFKHINDTYGHHFGDQVLISLASTIKKILRPQDLVGRIGGEEFAIYLQDLTVNNAKVIAERLLKNIEDSQIPYKEKMVNFTASIGISKIKGVDIEVALKNADTALYQAKARGKNQVIIAEE